MSNELSNARFLTAMAVAVVSDAISIFAEAVMPVQWVVDGLTAIALFIILGWRWPLLPALVAEAIPGVAAFPAWVLVVATLRLTHTVPKKDAQPAAAADSAPPRKHVENTAKD